MFIQLNDRKSRFLHGKWGFLPDNMGAFGLKRSRNIFEGLKPEEEDRAVEYDVDAFARISVPGDWNTQRRELFHFEGIGWYVRRLSLSEEELARVARGDRLFLRLDGVSFAVDAWFNGHKIGSAELPFLPLAFELKAWQLQSENLLVLRVDARRMAHRIPAEQFDWFNYGGLIRSVRLVFTPPAFVSQAACRATEILEMQGEGAAIRARYLVHGEGCSGGDFVRVELPALGWKTEAPLQAGKAEVLLELPSVVLWEPGQPKLYRSRISLVRQGRVVDSVRQHIGFKQIEVDGSRILLNRRPLFLRGAALHEERLGPVGGKPRNRRDIKRLIDLAEQLQANYLRLAHYPYDEQWLQECDRRGLLVWDEIPVYWDITYGDDRTRSLIVNCASRLAEMSRAHACVLCHAVANETWEAEGRAETMRMAVETFRRLDPGMPVAAAFNAAYRDGVYDVTAEPDALYEMVDIAGLNEYGGWYSPTLAELPNANIVVGDKPLLVTEFGAEGPLQTWGPSDKLWNLNSQEAIFTEQFRMFARCANLSGITPWVLKDFRSTLRANGFQHGWNCKGLVGRNGELKPVFALVRAAFAQKKALVQEKQDHEIVLPSMPGQSEERPVLMTG